MEFVGKLAPVSACGQTSSVPVLFSPSHRVAASPEINHKTKEAERMTISYRSRGEMQPAASRPIKPSPPPFLLTLILNIFFSLLSLFFPLGSYSVSYTLFTPLLFLTADIKSNEKERAHISVAGGEAAEI